MLVIALDGGDERIVYALDMPFLQRLLHESTRCEVEEDLWSRGWVEILSGLHGRESGGFYSKPKLDGTHDFHSTFGGRDYEQNDSITPIWEKINEKGSRVGVLGLNTTMPPSEVDGFFVAGPGGGFKPGIEVPEEACYPKEIAHELNERGYIWEARYRASGVREVSSFFNLLRREAKNRVQPFIDLANSYNIDVGFFHHKAPIVVQNIAMSEIEKLILNEGIPQNGVQKEIRDLYKCLDDSLREVYNSVEPSQYMIVSDHGSAPYRTAVNINSFLKEIGMQKGPSTITAGPKRLLKRLAKAVLPEQSASTVAHAVPSSVRNTEVDWSQTLAFGERYVSGVYINDRNRFDGPVKYDQEAKKLIREIIEAFNDSEEAQIHNMEAKPYRMNYEGAQFYDLLPDIWIDKPDTVFFEGYGDFVRPNPNYRPIKSLKRVDRDMYSGAKGSRPLLHVDEKTAQYRESEDPNDLTLAYYLIDRALHS